MTNSISTSVGQNEDHSRLNGAVSVAYKAAFYCKIRSKWARPKRKNKEFEDSAKFRWLFWNELETYEAQQHEAELRLIKSGKGFLRKHGFMGSAGCSPFSLEGRFCWYHTTPGCLWWQISELLAQLLFKYGHRENVSAFHSTDNALYKHTVT